MSCQLSTAAALALALSLGCAAGRHPVATPEPPRAAILRDELSSWVVGVQEPAIRYTDPDDSAPDVLDAVRDAGSLIEALRGTGLFAEVDFTQQLECTPNIELAVRARKGEDLHLAPLWLLPITLSIGILNDEEGVAFTSASDPGAIFEFHYPTTLVIGILPLLASPVLVTGAVPTWSFASTGPVDEELARFVLSNADRLRSFAHPPPPEGADEGNSEGVRGAPHPCVSKQWPATQRDDGAGRPHRRLAP